MNKQTPAGVNQLAAERADLRSHYRRALDRQSALLTDPQASGKDLRDVAWDLHDILTQIEAL